MSGVTQLDMHYVGAAKRERAGADFQIEPPAAHEAVGIAQLADFRPGSFKPLHPLAQRPGVILAKAEHIFGDQLGPRGFLGNFSGR